MLQDLLRNYDFGGDVERYKSYRDMDIGGDFWTWKNTYSQSHKDVTGDNNQPSGSYFKYSGPLMAKETNVDVSSSLWPKPPTFQSEVDFSIGKGTQAIARTLPDKPSASVANFFGELTRDGIPDLVGSIILRAQKFTRRGLAHEFLNYEFGIKPFISDLQKIAHSVIKANSLLEEYERNTGNNLRRRYTFTPTATTTVTKLTDTGTTNPSLVSNIYSRGTGPAFLTRTESVECWFTGNYRYHLNMGDEPLERMHRYAQEAEKLLGWEITPEVLWNLAPWSWLLDWFTTAGDLFTNVSAFSKTGLTLFRSYIMVHRTITDTYTTQLCRFHRGTDISVVSQTFGTESKLRKRAYPFSFSLVPTDLTATQWAILAALGITQSGHYGR
jgi:hypothetical protein